MNLNDSLLLKVLANFDWRGMGRKEHVDRRARHARMLAKKTGAWASASRQYRVIYTMTRLPWRRTSQNCYHHVKVNDAHAEFDPDSIEALNTQKIIVYSILIPEIEIWI